MKKNRKAIKYNKKKPIKFRNGFAVTITAIKRLADDCNIIDNIFHIVVDVSSIEGLKSICNSVRKLNYIELLDKFEKGEKTFEIDVFKNQLYKIEGGLNISDIIFKYLNIASLDEYSVKIKMNKSYNKCDSINETSLLSPSKNLASGQMLYQYIESMQKFIKSGDLNYVS